MKRIPMIACLLVTLCFTSALQLVAEEEYHRIGFNDLAAKFYNPATPEEKVDTVVRKDREYLERFVPENILDLDGKPVEIAGFMMPLSLNGQQVEEFFLMPDTGGCCFGMMPELNGYVFARAENGTSLFNNIPIRIRGKLEVQEVWQNGFFSHLYFVQVEEVVTGYGPIPSNSGIAP